MAKKGIAAELAELLPKIPTEKRAMAGRLADELIFLQSTLEQLKKKIKADGVVEEFKQGAQQFTREAPALKSYNVTLQRYSALHKQLAEMLPKDDNTESDLMEFVKGSGNE